jgi:hypothetical protein
MLLFSDESKELSDFSFIMAFGTRSLTFRYSLMSELSSSCSIFLKSINSLSDSLVICYSPINYDRVLLLACLGSF